jgi:hypothetical protein
MPLTALKLSDLPFTSAGTQACAAARAADVIMKLPNVPGEFRVRFIGTGIATIPDSTQNVFDVNHEQKFVDMVWYWNKFVGRHWLLGEFEVNLADNKTSTGTIEVIGDSTFGLNTINANDFYFDFNFKRFPFLNMTNVTPIRNSAVISAIPPVGSVYKLEKPENGKYEFKIGAQRILSRKSAPSRTIEFNQCDVVVFPEQNVGLTLIEQQRATDGSYNVSVQIENITNREATFAYFSVIHYVGVTINNDYGFVLLKATEKTIVSYRVISSINDRTIDLPFFTALYEPAAFQGSKSLPLIFEF